MRGAAGDQTLALRAFARKLAGAADSFSLLARLLYGRLLVVAAKLHFAEYAFTLQLFLQRTKRLINIVVANQNLHASDPIVPHPARGRSAVDMMFRKQGLWRAPA
ncbi:hypothetical protein ADZ37_08500 [Pannonibacter phragmitetus]|nr:hypothetical protein ADZ37_08500 [Pannonibacter phragmitetus]